MGTSTRRASPLPRRGPVLGLITALACLATPLAAQETFRSHQSANLATAQTLRGGNLLFEVSHRFVPPVSEGSRALWGVDGPAWIRLGLSYAPTDGVLVGIVRTNNQDNLELNGRARFFRQEIAGTPVELAVVAGSAWNTDAPPLDAFDGSEDNELQLYAQLLVDALLADRLAVGLVPTYLRNPRIRDFETDNTFSLGLHGQWYVGRTVSFLGEWIFTEELQGLEHDTGTFGIELRTRGHFFKLLVTNQPALGMTQLLAGSPNPFQLDELRFGFNLTRLLPL